MPAPDGPTIATFLAGANLEIDGDERRLARPVPEMHVLERDRAAQGREPHDVFGFGEILRHHQRLDRLGDAVPVLQDIDERHGKVARGLQQREREGGAHHDVAGADEAALPQQAPQPSVAPESSHTAAA